jgi:hypothetical protein
MIQETIPEEIQKYIEMKKKPLEINKIVQPMNQIVDRRYKPLVLMPPPKVDKVQLFYETMAEQWYQNKSVKLWNFTINPDPRKMDKKWSNKQIENWLTKEINNVFCRNKYIRELILEYVIFFEIGDQKGKFHCNVTTKFRGESEDRMLHIIKDKINTKFGSRSLNIKDQHTFKSPDVYNNKDASFMTKMGHRPKYYKLEHDQPDVKKQL